MRGRTLISGLAGAAVAVSFAIHAPILAATDETPVAAGGVLCVGVPDADGGAAIVNLTPVGASGPGWARLTSSGASGGSAGSNVNYRPGSVDPNVAVAPVGVDGQVCVLNSPLASVHMVIDLLGVVDVAAYRPATPDGAPLRLADTRTHNEPVAAGGVMCVDVPDADGGAAIVNLTPVGASGPGWARLTSSGASGGSAGSNVNYRPGSVDPNVAVAPVGVDGQVCVLNSPLASVHMVIDLLGVVDVAAYRPATPDGAPLRLADTRTHNEPVAAGGVLCVDVPDADGGAAIVNLTPVGASGPGWARLTSSGASGGSAGSNVNYRPGSVDPNVAVAPVGVDGQVCVLNSPLASVHMVIDLLGVVDVAAYRPATPDGAPLRLADTRIAFGDGSFDATATFGEIPDRALAVTSDGRVAAAKGTNVQVRGRDGGLATIQLPPGVQADHLWIGTDDIAVAWGDTSGAEVDITQLSVVSQLELAGDGWTRTDPAPGYQPVEPDKNIVNPLELALLVTSDTTLPASEGAGCFQVFGEGSASWIVPRPGECATTDYEIATSGAGGYTVLFKAFEPDGQEDVYPVVLAPDGEIVEHAPIDAEADNAIDFQPTPNSVVVLYRHGSTLTVRTVLVRP